MDKGGRGVPRPHTNDRFQKFTSEQKLLPSKAELAVSAKEVDMISELQFEDVVLADAVLFGRHSNLVTQQRQTRQWTVVLSASSAW